MANLQERSDVVLVTSNGVPTWGASYKVIAYDIGAQVQSVSGASVTVRAGHGFTNTDKCIVLTEADGTISEDSFRSVSSTTSTNVTLGSAVAGLAAGDFLINLGADTGSAGAVNYDGGTLTTYSDMAGGTAVPNETVTCDAQGNYQYWHNTAEIWELILDSNTNPVGLKIVQGNLTAVNNLQIGGSVGFYGTAPQSQPSAYTQTYSTADKTHANPTAAALTDSSGGTADQTVAAVSGSGADSDINNNFAECADEINKLVADVADVKQLLNSVIDDLQALGLLQ